MLFKVAFIGAGSIGFTRGLLTDLLSVPEFHDIQVAFTDINPDNLRMVTQLCQRDIDEKACILKFMRLWTAGRLLRTPNMLLTVSGSVCWRLLQRMWKSP